MSVSTGIPFNVGPLNSIQPFTYRDSTGHMAMLEKLRVYINDVLRPEFNEEMQRIIDEFQEGLTNAETIVTEAKDGWQALFDQFMIDVDAQLQALNDTSVANLINNDESATGAAIRALFGHEFNVRHYGALGDGVNDTAAIRATLTAAGAAAVVHGRATVILPPGNYHLLRGTELTWVFPGDGQFEKYFLSVPAGVTVKGVGGRITYNCDYDNRAVVFYTAGSNVTYDGVITEDLYDMAGGSRPTGIPIAGGDAYDATFAGTLANINIRNCEFIRPWYPTKFGMTKDNGTAQIRGVHITNCKSFGEVTSVSSGGYNFVSRIPGRVRDISVNNSRCYDVTVSAAVGIYGCWDFVVSNNYLRGSTINGGGVQTENGAFNGVISGNTLVDHFNHVWTDDSNDIAIVGNSMRNTDVNSNYKAVRITYQGFTDDISHTSGNILVSSNRTKNCYMCTELFSTPPVGGSPVLDVVEFVDNVLDLDGVTIPHGIRIGSATVVRVANNIVTGATEYSLRFSPNIGQLLSVTGNLTRDRAGQVDTAVGMGILTLNASGPLVSDNRFENGLPTDLTYVTARVGGVRIVVGAGDPTDAVAAPRGSIYLRNDAPLSTSALYVKPGDGLNGWIAH